MPNIAFADGESGGGGTFDCFGGVLYFVTPGGRVLACKPPPVECAYIEDVSPNGDNWNKCTLN